MAASNTRVARESTAASGRSPGPVHARSISQSPWHCGWITIKPMPSAVTGLGAPRTAAFPPGTPPPLPRHALGAMGLGREAGSPPPPPLDGGRRARGIPARLRILEDLGIRELTGGAMRHQFKGTDHVRQRGSQG